MRILRRTHLILLALPFFLSPRVHSQSPSQVSRVHKDWQSVLLSRTSGEGPVYPPLAVATRIEGCVRLEFVISTDGVPQDLTVLSGHPLLVGSALDAVKKWRFKSAAPGNAAVEIETVATVDFFLPGHDSGTLVAPYRKNVEKHPNDAKEHISLGWALLDVGKPDEAAAEFRNALSLDPKNAEAHLHLGEAFAANGDLDAAIGEYRAGIAIKPNDPKPHYDLARLLDKKGDLDSALAEYRLGLQMQPKEGNAHYGLGLLLLKKQDFDAALSEFRLAMHYGDANPFVHYELGRALEGKGDVAAAAKEFQKAAKDMPSNEMFREARDRTANSSHP